MKAMLKVLILSLIGGYLFSLLHIPIPWMLGPIVFVMTAQFFYKGPLIWSGRLPDIGIAIVGTVIGIQFNVALFSMMGSISLYIVVLNIILIGGAIGIAYCTSKWTKMPMKTAVLGSMPGGLSQILIFAEEEKVKEMGFILYFQVIRLLLVVVLVPFIVAGPTVSKVPSDANFTVNLWLLIAVAWGCSHLTKKIHLPVAFFITPIVLVLVIQLISPTLMPPVPSIIMDIAQLLIGAHIGLMLKPHMLKLPTRVLIAGILSAVALIILTLGSSYLMALMMETDFATSFLSTAPGGLDQMVLLADAIKADASIVSLFQTFRLLFIFILIMPLLKLFYSWYNKRLLDSVTLQISKDSEHVDPQ